MHRERLDHHFSTSKRQVGQVRFSANHLVTQDAWNTCPHGSRTTHSEILTSSMHTAHVAPCSRRLAAPVERLRSRASESPLRSNDEAQRGAELHHGDLPSHISGIEGQQRLVVSATVCDAIASAFSCGQSAG